MRITFLGTGTSQGIPVIGCTCPVCSSTDLKDKRLRVSIWIEHQDTHLIVDTSPDFRIQCLTAQVPRVDALLMTHEHRDHIGGLDDIRPYNFKYEMDIPVYALERVMDNLRRTYKYIFDANYPGVPSIIPHHITKDSIFTVQNTTIQAIGVQHGELPILGFRVDNFAYLTDLKHLDDTEIAKLQQLDLVVISALHHEPHHSHSNLEEALYWSSRINAKQTYFTHLSHNMGTHQATEATLPPHIRIAYDGLQLTI